MNQNRRNFIKLTGLATSATLLSSLESFSSAPLPVVNTNGNYKLKVLATNWGFDGTIDAFCAKAKKEGYDGIENWWPENKNEQDEMFAALKKHKLEIGFLYGAWQTNPAEHLSHFKKVMDTIAMQKIQTPLYINLHSGRDYFSFDDNKKFTLDISHWCNVHESLLDDQPETIELALQRTEHIHARIGYAEGPQVNDPRAPEWEGTVKQHFAWWDKVVERKKKNGETMTFLTEFGPPLYMPTLPYTLQAVSNQWEINVHMLQLLRKRYS